MEGSLSWDRRGAPMSCVSGPRGRALEALADPARAKGAIRRIAEELGVHPEALRTWVKKAQVDGGLRSGTTTDKAQRIKELDKEVRKLRRANAIPKSASACLSRRSVSARPVDLPEYIDSRKKEFGAWPICKVADRRRSQDRPEHLTHAAKTRSPSARSLRDETLKAEISKVHKNQLLGAGGPQDARDAGPTRDRRASRCRSRGPVYRRTPHGRPGPARRQTRQVPAHHAQRTTESSARPTWSGATSRRLLRVGCGSPTFPRKREVSPPVYAPSPGGSMWLSSPTCTPGGSSAGRPPTGQCAPTWPRTP